MGNDLSHNSYIRTDACSARNITWQYIHTFGQVPKSYTLCPSYAATLASHCCSDGICTPNPLTDREFKRYGWQEYAQYKKDHNAPAWDGLGNPLQDRVWPADLPEQLHDVVREKMRRKDRELNATQYSWKCDALFHGGWSEEGDWPVDIVDHRRSKRDEWEICETEGEWKGMCRMASFWDHGVYYPRYMPWWVDVEVQQSTAETVARARDLDGGRGDAVAGVEFTG